MPRVFDEETVTLVFAKAKRASGTDPNKRLCPSCGTHIHINARVDKAPSHWKGKTNSFAWHVDHVRPKSKGGGAELGNLQPLCSKCNMRKGNREE